MTPVVCAWPALQPGAEQMWWHLLVVLICTPLVAGQVKDPHVFEHPESLSYEVPLHVACLFFPWAVCVFIYLFELNPRFWRRAFVSEMLHYLLPACSLRFHFFKLSFDEQKCLISMSNVSLISFVVLWFCFSIRSGIGVCVW